jgi:hypothetical protein
MDRRRRREGIGMRAWPGFRFSFEKKRIKIIAHFLWAWSAWSGDWGMGDFFFCYFAWSGGGGVPSDAGTGGRGCRAACAVGPGRAPPAPAFAEWGPRAVWLGACRRDSPVMMDVGGSMIIVVSYYASALGVAPNHRPCHWRSA